MVAVEDDAADERSLPRVVDSQRRAANPAISAWVSASAGTGKTTVLTDRVLRLLLAGAPPQRILCLTFTKAAAAEMANRIDRDSAMGGRWPRPSLRNELASPDRRAAGDAKRWTLARQLFARVLDVPGGLQIQTIHAFCQIAAEALPARGRGGAAFRRSPTTRTRRSARDARAGYGRSACRSGAGRRPRTVASLARRGARLRRPS